MVRMETNEKIHSHHSGGDAQSARVTGGKGITGIQRSHLRTILSPPFKGHQHLTSGVLTKRQYLQNSVLSTFSPITKYSNYTTKENIVVEHVSTSPTTTLSPNKTGFQGSQRDTGLQSTTRDQNATSPPWKYMARYDIRLVNHYKNEFNKELQKDEEECLMWFDTDVFVHDLIDASEPPTHREFTVTGKVREKNASTTNPKGRVVTVNGTKIALFKYKSKCYAIKHDCPHMGGALSMGDIEDIDGKPCIACPVHKWRFELETGNCLISEKYNSTAYPLRVNKEMQLFIGFSALNQRLFCLDDSF